MHPDIIRAMHTSMPESFNAPQNGGDDQHKSFCYQRIVARDARCDGQFLTAVHTTGIYCLPSCPARKPRVENVSFFRTEREAIEAGFRPCKRCRPDLFYQGADWNASLYETLLTRIRTAPESAPSVGRLAELCGVSLSSLNTLVREHAHLTPGVLLRREHIRAAKFRLAHTREKIVEIGLAAGFESEATFHRQFLATTGMTPGAYRALACSDRFQVRLPDRYRCEDTLAYFSRDAERTCEAVSGRTIAKAVATRAGAAVLTIEFQPDGCHALCQIHAPHPLDIEDKMSMHEIASRMLGLTHDVDGFESRASRESPVARLVAAHPGLRPPLSATPFEALVWAVVGQQINLPFATALRRAVIERAGLRVSGTDLRLHPTPEQVANIALEDLSRMKFSRSKADYLTGVAQAVHQGGLDLAHLAEGSALLAERALLAQRGIGPWTAHYVMLRGFGFGDCVPVGDTGLSAGLKRFHAVEGKLDAEKTQALMRDFAPHRSLATAHLWASLKDPT